MCKVKVSSRVDEDILNRLKQKYSTDSFTDILNILIDNDMSDVSDKSDNIFDKVSLSDVSDVYRKNYELNRMVDSLFEYKNRLQLVHNVLIDEVNRIGHTDFTYVCPCCKKINHSSSGCDCSAQIYSPLQNAFRERAFK